MCNGYFFLRISFHKKIIHPPAIFAVAHSRAEPDLDKDSDEYARQYLKAGSGFILGLGGVFCREPHMPALTVVVSAQNITSFEYIVFFVLLNVVLQTNGCHIVIRDYVYVKTPHMLQFYTNVYF